MENAKIETTENKPIESAALNLMLSDEAVSSQQQNVTDIVNRAASVRDQGIQSAEASRDAQIAGIEGTFGREERTLGLNIEQAKRSFAQGSSMGTSTAKFKLLNDTINKNLGDIKSRKEEARLNADAAFEAQLTNLEMNYLEQQQQATQQAFNNILGIAGLSQQAQQIQLQEKTQEFAQRQALGQISLQYGVEVEDGDTLESMLNKAIPVVQNDRSLDEKERELRMDQIRQSIATAKAQEATTRAQAADIAARANNRKAQLNYLQGLSDDEIVSLSRQGVISSDMLVESGQTGALKLMVSNERDALKASAISKIQEMKNDNVDDKVIIDTIQALNPNMTQNEIAVYLAEEKQKETRLQSGVKALTESRINMSTIQEGVGSIRQDLGTDERNKKLSDIRDSRNGIDSFMQGREDFLQERNRINGAPNNGTTGIFQTGEFGRKF